MSRFSLAVRAHAFVLPALISTGASLAADLPRRTESAPPPLAVQEPYFYGSASLSLNALIAPAQLGATTLVAPYLGGGVKLTYAPRDYRIGMQFDLNAGGADASWVRPTIDGTGQGYTYGAALHAFTTAIPNARIGVFIGGDWLKISAPGVSVPAVPYYQGGLEGQYLLRDDILLRARAGYGQFMPKGLFNDGTIRGVTPFAGVGVTWRLNPAWQVGADAHYVQARVAAGGLSEDIGSMIDVGGFVEYRLSALPLVLRGEGGFFQIFERISDPGDRAQPYGLRAKLALRYEFGGGNRSLLSEQFGSYMPLFGVR